MILCFDMTASGTFSFVAAEVVNDLPSGAFGIDEELCDLDRTMDAITVVNRQLERKNSKAKEVLRNEELLYF